MRTATWCGVWRSASAACEVCAAKVMGRWVEWIGGASTGENASSYRFVAPVVRRSLTNRLQAPPQPRAVSRLSAQHQRVSSIRLRHFQGEACWARLEDCASLRNRQLCRVDGRRRGPARTQPSRRLRLQDDRGRSQAKAIA